MPGMGILQKQIAIVERFQALPNWEERYKQLIALGRRLPPLPPEEQTDEAKVRGCSSSVWLHADLVDGKVRYRADSDALIVKGLVSLLLEVYSDEAPADIVKHEPLFIEELGLNQHLSANRANGLSSMVKQIKTYAVALQAQG